MNVIVIFSLDNYSQNRGCFCKHANVVKSRNAHIIIQYTNETMYIYMYIIQRKRKRKTKIWKKETAANLNYVVSLLFFPSVSGGNMSVWCFICSSVSISSIQERFNCSWELEIFDDEFNGGTIGVDNFEDWAE